MVCLRQGGAAQSEATTDGPATQESQLMRNQRGLLMRILELARASEQDQQSAISSLTTRLEAISQLRNLISAGQRSKQSLTAQEHQELESEELLKTELILVTQVQQVGEPHRHLRPHPVPSIMFRLVAACCF